MKILVTGVGGQLGHDVMNELIGRGHTGVGSDIAPEYSGVADGSAVTTAEYVPMDITDAAQVSEVITKVSPDVVIHCAAWTAVDAAEDDDKKAEIFSHMAEAFDDALFALPIMVRKEDLVVEDGNTSVLIMYLMVRVKHLGNQTARTTSLLMYMERLSLPENLLFLTLLTNTLSCVLHGYLVLMERTLLRLCLMLERLMTRFVLSTTRLVHQLTH